jgi:hypothetical protein
MALDDPDGDGWGVCAPTGPLDPVTVVWWSKVGAFRKALCDSGYDTANRMSMVPGGLDRPTYEFLCTTLAPDGAASSEA